MGEKIVQLKVKMPKQVMKYVDLIVDKGYFTNRNEVLREAIRMHLREVKNE